MTHRTFISIILAAAIAVTGMTAAPARADDDTAKIIAGVAALAIIGAAIAEERKDRRRKAVTRNRGYGYNYDYNYGRHDNFNPRKRNRYLALPAACRRHFRTRGGQVFGFGRRCLLNNYSSFNTLPHNCAGQFRLNNGRVRTIYGARCLKRHGYYAS